MGRVQNAALAALVGIAGCQSGEARRAEINRYLDERLSAYHGVSMASFIERTGLTAVNAYPITGGRVFVIEGAPIYTTLPATHVTPAITRSAACQLLLHTVPTGTAGTADDWQIVGTSRSGPCNNLPV